MPDLKVGELWVEQNDLRVIGDLDKGAEFKFVGAFSNVGLDAPGFWKIGRYLDGTLVNSQDLQRLPAGNSGASFWLYSPAGQVVGAHTCE